MITSFQMTVFYSSCLFPEFGMGCNSAKAKYLLARHSYKRNCGRLWQLSMLSENFLNGEVLLKKMKEITHIENKYFSLWEARLSEDLSVNQLYLLKQWFFSLSSPKEIHRFPARNHSLTQLTAVPVQLQIRTHSPLLERRAHFLHGFIVT